MSVCGRSHSSCRVPTPCTPALRAPLFLPQVSQAAAEAVVKQGGNKDEANKAAQAASAAAVAAANDAQKKGATDLATVAKTAAAPVVDAYSKSKDAKAGGG